jgi:hypothetical protein
VGLDSSVSTGTFYGVDSLEIAARCK